METFTFRLRPGEDLEQEITRFVHQHNVQAGCVLSGVGSLAHAVLRLANQENGAHYDGHFEIVSITGTVAVSGSHLHLSISSETGVTTGGHLLPGCIIYTTAEIIIAVLPDIVYRRELCPESGYEELVVYPAEQRQD